MLSLKHSDDIAYNGVTNVARMDLYADTAADLTGVTSFDSITLLGGSTVLDIATGDEYIMQTNGTWIKQPSQAAFSNVYTKAEIDAIIANYYTKAQSDNQYEWITLMITTETLPITFIADGSQITAWSMLGNGQQTGTPTPDNPIQPDFVGTLDNSDWTIPITCAEQTVTVNLGVVQTVRKIRKLVFDGTEGWSFTNSGKVARLSLSDYLKSEENVIFCTHYKGIAPVSGYAGVGDGETALHITNNYLYIYDSRFMQSEYTTYFAAQYAAGTPIVIWYVLANEQTGITNEPLAKIGDYADELSSTDAGVTISTIKGANTLTVDTTLQPSEITITGKIRET